jgi:phage-related protein
MMGHELRFYETEEGSCQVRDYLRSQNKKVRGHAGWLLTRLEEEAHELDRPIIGHLGDGIYELRVIVDKQQHRLLFFYHHKTIVVTSAFLKKSDKVPPMEIGRAMRARADWLRREEE